MNTRSFILSALLAGLFMALFGNIPLLNLVNCILCLWVWLGGALAVWLYRRFQKGGQGLTSGQGALLGAVTGVVGALLGFPLYLATARMMNTLFATLIQRLALEGDIPMWFDSDERIVAQAIGFLILDIFVYAIFGAIAGLITANMLWKKPPLSSTTIDVPAVPPRPAPVEDIPHPSPVVEAPVEPPVIEAPPEPPVVEAAPEPPAVETPNEWQVAETPPEAPAPEIPSEWLAGDTPPAEPPAEQPPA